MTYRLAERVAAVVVVECSAVAGAASGKSGGFLALDWRASSATGHGGISSAARVPPV